MNPIHLGFGPDLDPDAADYIAAVEEADGQAMEEAFKTAINEFVVGCKIDGVYAKFDWAYLKVTTNKHRVWTKQKSC